MEHPNSLVGKHNNKLICDMNGVSMSAKSFQHVRLCAALWTVTCQASLYMGFSRQEYWKGLPCPSPGDLPDPGI